jgi:TonB family protein
MTTVPPPVAINALDVSISTGTGDAIAMGVPSPDLVVQDVAKEIERMFTFEDLEEAPRLINAPSYRFPPGLVRRGITAGRVMVEIDILPSGKAEFRRVISTTHPELVELARQIVARAQFTKPIVNGRPQRVRGSFPLNLAD